MYRQSAELYLLIFLKGIRTMELIVISRSKLKIMLTEPDMQHYHLEATHMNCTDAHTREAFRHIFDDARDEIGFDTEGKRLFVQLYTSKGGGCEIFVTKLENFPPVSSAYFLNNENKNEEQDIPKSVLAIKTENLSEGEETLLEQIYQNQIDLSKTLALSGKNSFLETPDRKLCIQFTNLENLLISCRRLLRSGYRERNSVYIEETDHGTMWYLFLSFAGCNVDQLPTCYSFLTEYGRVEKSGGLLMHLSEYGRCIWENNAVDIFGEL